MKKLIILGIVATLVACTTQPPSTQQTPSETISNQQILHFVGPYDLTLTLTTQDNFETATLTDNSDQQHLLKREMSANGIRLSNDAGVTIHFKNTADGNQGYVELVKDKSIEISEFKK